MENELRFESNYASPPSETLKEVLSDRRITLSRLSKLSSLDYDVLISVMENKVKIDKSISEKLEEGLEIPSSFWLNLENNYQSTMKRLKKSSYLE